MPTSIRTTLTGRGTAGKVAVAAIRDRSTNQVAAQPVENTEGDTLKGFVMWKIVPSTAIHTNDARAYTNLPNHQAVKVHTKGTLHRLSRQHLHPYVDEFVAHHYMREMDTFEQMAAIARGMENAQLRYKELVA